MITLFKADRNEELLKKQLRALAVKTINETIDDDDDDEGEEAGGGAGIGQGADDADQVRGLVA